MERAAPREMASQAVRETSEFVFVVKALDGQDFGAVAPKGALSCTVDIQTQHRCGSDRPGQLL
jgi:hypothetical protein